MLSGKFYTLSCYLDLSRSLWHHLFSFLHVYFRWGMPGYRVLVHNLTLLLHGKMIWQWHWKIVTVRSQLVVSFQLLFSTSLFIVTFLYYRSCTLAMLVKYLISLLLLHEQESRCTAIQGQVYPARLSPESKFYKEERADSVRSFCLLIYLPLSVMQHTGATAPATPWGIGEGATHKLKPSPILFLISFCIFPHFFHTSEFRFPYSFNNYMGQRCRLGRLMRFFLARRGSAFSVMRSVAVLLRRMGMLEGSTVDMATCFSRWMLY